MRRKDRIEQIERLEVELDGCLERVAASSRRPLKLMHRHNPWLLPGAGLLTGIVLARMSTRHMVARAISGTLLLLRAQRLLLRWMKRV